MSSRHQRDAHRLRLVEILRQRQPLKVDHHVNARQRAARRRCQCPKPRHEHCAVGAQRRDIDGDEHSARIQYVMADMSPRVLTSTSATLLWCSATSVSRDSPRTKQHASATRLQPQPILSRQRAPARARGELSPDVAQLVVLVTVRQQTWIPNLSGVPFASSRSECTDEG